MLTGGGHPTIAPLGSSANVTLGRTPDQTGGHVVATGDGVVFPLFCGVHGAAPASLLAPWAHTSPALPAGDDVVVPADVFSSPDDVTRLFVYTTPCGDTVESAAMAHVPMPVNPLTQWVRPEDAVRAHALAKSAGGVQPRPYVVDYTGATTVRRSAFSHSGEKGARALAIAAAALSQATARTAAAYSHRLKSHLATVGDSVVHPESIDAALWASAAAHAASMCRRFAEDMCVPPGRRPNHYTAPAHSTSGTVTSSELFSLRLPPSHTDISMLVDRIRVVTAAYKVAVAVPGEVYNEASQEPLPAAPDAEAYTAQYGVAMALAAEVLAAHLDDMYRVLVWWCSPDMDAQGPKPLSRDEFVVALPEATLQAAVHPGAPQHQSLSRDMTDALNILAEATAKSPVSSKGKFNPAALTNTATAEAQFLFQALRPPASLFSVWSERGKLARLGGMSTVHRQVQAYELLRGLADTPLHWSNDPRAWGIAGGHAAPGTWATKPLVPPGGGPWDDRLTAVLRKAATVMAGSEQPPSSSSQKTDSNMARWKAIIQDTARATPLSDYPDVHRPFSSSPRARASAIIVAATVAVRDENNAANREAVKAGREPDAPPFQSVTPTFWRWTTVGGVGLNARNYKTTSGRRMTAEEAVAAEARTMATPANVSVAWQCAGAGVSTILAACPVGDRNHPLLPLLKTAPIVDVANAIVAASDGMLQDIAARAVRVSSERMMMLKTKGVADGIERNAVHAAFCLDAVADIRLLTLARAAIDVTIPHDAGGVTGLNPGLPIKPDTTQEGGLTLARIEGGAVFDSSVALQWGNIVTKPMAALPFTSKPGVVLTVYDTTTATCHELTCGAKARRGVELGPLLALGHGAAPGHPVLAGIRNPSAPSPAMGTIPEAAAAGYWTEARHATEASAQAAAAAALSYARGATTARVDSLNSATLALSAGMDSARRIPVDVAGALDAVPTSVRSVLEPSAVKVVVFFESHDATGDLPLAMPYAASIEPQEVLLPRGDGEFVGSAAWVHNIRATALHPGHGDAARERFHGKIADLQMFGPPLVDDDAVDSNGASSKPYTAASASAEGSPRRVGVVFDAVTKPVAVFSRGVGAATTQVVVCLNGREWTVFGATMDSAFSTRVVASTNAACSWYPWVCVPCPVTWTSLPDALLTPGAHASAFNTPVVEVGDNSFNTDVSRELTPGFVADHVNKPFDVTSTAVPSVAALVGALRRLDDGVNYGVNALLHLLRGIASNFATGVVEKRARRAALPSVLAMLRAPEYVKTFKTEGLDVPELLRTMQTATGVGHDDEDEGPLAMPEALPPLGHEPTDDAILARLLPEMDVPSVDSVQTEIDTLLPEMRTLMSATDIRVVEDAVPHRGTSLKMDVAMATASDDALRAWDVLADVDVDDRRDPLDVATNAWTAVAAIEPNPVWFLLHGDLYDVLAGVVDKGAGPSSGAQHAVAYAAVMLSVHQATVDALLAHLAIEADPDAARGPAMWTITLGWKTKVRIGAVSVAFAAACTDWGTSKTYDKRDGEETVTVARVPWHPTTAPRAPCLVGHLNETARSVSDRMRSGTRATWMAGVETDMDAAAQALRARNTTIVPAVVAAAWAKCGARWQRPVVIGAQDGVAVQTLRLRRGDGGAVFAAVASLGAWDEFKNTDVPLVVDAPMARVLNRGGTLDITAGGEPGEVPYEDHTEVIVVDTVGNGRDGDDADTATISFPAEHQTVVDLELPAPLALEQIIAVLGGDEEREDVVANLGACLKVATLLFDATSTKPGGMSRVLLRAGGAAGAVDLRDGNVVAAAEEGIAELVHGDADPGDVDAEEAAEFVRRAVAVLGQDWVADFVRDAPDIPDAGGVDSSLKQWLRRARVTPATVSAVLRAIRRVRKVTSQMKAMIDARAAMLSKSHTVTLRGESLQCFLPLDTVDSNPVMRQLMLRAPATMMDEADDVRLHHDDGDADAVARAARALQPQVWAAIRRANAALQGRHQPSARRKFVVDRLCESLRTVAADQANSLGGNEAALRDIQTALTKASRMEIVVTDEVAPSRIWTLAEPITLDPLLVRRRVQALSNMDQVAQWLWVYTRNAASHETSDQLAVHDGLVSLGAVILLVDHLARVAIKPDTIADARDDRGRAGGREYDEDPTTGVAWRDELFIDDAAAAMAAFDGSQWWSAVRGDFERWTGVRPQYAFRAEWTEPGDDLALPVVPVPVLRATRDVYRQIVPAMDVVVAPEADDEADDDTRGNVDLAELAEQDAAEAGGKKLLSNLEKHPGFKQGNRAWWAALQRATDDMPVEPDAELASPLDAAGARAEVQRQLGATEAFDVLRRAVEALRPALAVEYRTQVMTSRMNRLMTRLRDVAPAERDADGEVVVPEDGVTLANVGAVLQWEGWADLVWPGRTETQLPVAEAGVPHSFKTTKNYLDSILPAALEKRTADAAAAEEGGGEDDVPSEEEVRDTMRLRATANTQNAKLAVKGLAVIGHARDLAATAPRELLGLEATDPVPADPFRAFLRLSDGEAMPGGDAFWTWFDDNRGDPVGLMANPRKQWVMFMTGLAAGFNATQVTHTALNAVVKRGLVRVTADDVDAAMDGDDTVPGGDDIHHRASAALAGLRGGLLFAALRDPYAAAQTVMTTAMDRDDGEYTDAEAGAVRGLLVATTRMDVHNTQELAGGLVAAVKRYHAAQGKETTEPRDLPSIAAVAAMPQLAVALWMMRDSGQYPHCKEQEDMLLYTDPLVAMRRWMNERNKRTPATLQPEKDASVLLGVVDMLRLFATEPQRPVIDVQQREVMVGVRDVAAADVARDLTDFVAAHKAGWIDPEDDSVRPPDDVPVSFQVAMTTVMEAAGAPSMVTQLGPSGLRLGRAVVVACTEILGRGDAAGRTRGVSAVAVDGGAKAVLSGAIDFNARTFVRHLLKYMEGVADGDKAHAACFRALDHLAAAAWTAYTDFCGGDNSEDVDEAVAAARTEDRRVAVVMDIVSRVVCARGVDEAPPSVVKSLKRFARALTDGVLVEKVASERDAGEFCAPIRQAFEADVQFPGDETVQAEIVVSAGGSTFVAARAEGSPASLRVAPDEDGKRLAVMRIIKDCIRPALLAAGVASYRGKRACVPPVSGGPMPRRQKKTAVQTPASLVRMQTAIEDAFYVTTFGVRLARPSPLAAFVHAEQVCTVFLAAHQRVGDVMAHTAGIEKDKKRGAKIRTKRMEERKAKAAEAREALTAVAAGVGPVKIDTLDLNATDAFFASKIGATSGSVVVEDGAHLRVVDVVHAVLAAGGVTVSKPTADTGMARFALWTTGSFDVPIVSPPGVFGAEAVVGDAPRPVLQHATSRPRRHLQPFLTRATLDGRFTAQSQRSARGNGVASVVTWSTQGPQAVGGMRTPSLVAMAQFPFGVLAVDDQTAVNVMHRGRAVHVVSLGTADVEAKTEGAAPPISAPPQFSGDRLDAQTIEVESPALARQHMYTTPRTDMACLALERGGRVVSGLGQTTVTRRVWGVNTRAAEITRCGRDVAVAVSALARHVVLVRKHLVFGPLTGGAPAVYFVTAVEGVPVAVARDGGHIVVPGASKKVVFAVWGRGHGDPAFALHLHRRATWRACDVTPLEAGNWEDERRLRAVWTSRRLQTVLDHVRSCASFTHVVAADAWLYTGLSPVKPRVVSVTSVGAATRLAIMQALRSGSVDVPLIRMLVAVFGINAVRCAAEPAATAMPGRCKVQLAAAAVRGDPGHTYQMDKHPARVVAALETGWWSMAVPGLAATVAAAREAVLNRYTAPSDTQVMFRAVKVPWVDAPGHMNLLAPAGGVPASNLSGEVSSKHELGVSLQWSWPMAFREERARLALRTYFNKVVAGVRSILGDAFAAAQNNVAFLAGTQSAPGFQPTARIALVRIAGDPHGVHIGPSDSNSNGLVSVGAEPTQLTGAIRTARAAMKGGVQRQKYAAGPPMPPALDSNSEVDTNRGAWRSKYVPTGSDVLPAGVTFATAQDVVDMVMHDGTPVSPSVVGRWAMLVSSDRSTATLVTVLSPPMVLDTTTETEPCVHVLAPVDTPGLLPMAGWPAVGTDPTEKCLVDCAARSAAFVRNWLDRCPNWKPGAPAAAGAGGDAGVKRPRRSSVFETARPPKKKDKKDKKGASGGGGSKKRAASEGAAPPPAQRARTDPANTLVEWTVARVPRSALELSPSGVPEDDADDAMTYAMWVAAAPKGTAPGKRVKKARLLPNTGFLQETAAREGLVLVPVHLAEGPTARLGSMYGPGWCVRALDARKSLVVFGHVEDVLVDFFMPIDTAEAVNATAVGVSVSRSPTSRFVLEPDMVLDARPPAPMGVVMTTGRAPAVVGACLVSTTPRYGHTLAPVTVQANAGATFMAKHTTPWTLAISFRGDVAGVTDVSMFAPSTVVSGLAASVIAGTGFPTAAPNSTGSPVLNVRGVTVAQALAAGVTEGIRTRPELWTGSAMRTMFRAAVADAVRRMTLDRAFANARSLGIKPHPSVAQYAYAALGARRVWGLRLLVTTLASEAAWDLRGGARASAKLHTVLTTEGARAAACAGLPGVDRVRRAAVAAFAEKTDDGKAKRDFTLVSTLAVATAALQFSAGCVSAGAGNVNIMTGMGPETKTGVTWAPNPSATWTDAFLDWVSSTVTTAAIEQRPSPARRGKELALSDEAQRLAPLIMPLLVTVSDLEDAQARKAVSGMRAISNPFMDTLRAIVLGTLARKGSRWTNIQIASRIMPGADGIHTRLTELASPACRRVAAAAADLVNTVAHVTDARPPHGLVANPFERLYSAVFKALLGVKNVLTLDPKGNRVANCLDDALARCLQRGNTDATRTVADRIAYMPHIRPVAAVEPPKAKSFTGNNTAEVCGPWPRQPAVSADGYVPFNVFRYDVAGRGENLIAAKNTGFLALVSHKWPSAMVADDGEEALADHNADLARGGDVPKKDLAMRHVWVVPALETYVSAAAAPEHEAKRPNAVKLAHKAGVGVMSCNRVSSLILHPPAKEALAIARGLKTSEEASALRVSDRGRTGKETLQQYRVASSEWIASAAGRLAELSRLPGETLAANIGKKAYHGMFMQLSDGVFNVGRWAEPRGAIEPFRDLLPTMPGALEPPADVPAVRDADAGGVPNLTPAGAVLVNALACTAASNTAMALYLTAELNQRMDDASAAALIQYRCSVIDVPGDVSLDTVVAATVHPSVAWDSIEWPDVARHEDASTDGYDDEEEEDDGERSVTHAAEIEYKAGEPGDSGSDGGDDGSENDAADGRADASDANDGYDGMVPDTDSEGGGDDAGAFAQPVVEDEF